MNKFSISLPEEAELTLKAAASKAGVPPEEYVRVAIGFLSYMHDETSSIQAKRNGTFIALCDYNEDIICKIDLEFK